MKISLAEQLARCACEDIIACAPIRSNCFLGSTPFVLKGCSPLERLKKSSLTHLGEGTVLLGTAKAGLGSPKCGIPQDRFELSRLVAGGFD